VGRFLTASSKVPVRSNPKSFPQTSPGRDRRIQSPARQCRGAKATETKSPLGDGTTNFRKTWGRKTGPYKARGKPEHKFIIFRRSFADEHDLSCFSAYAACALVRALVDCYWRHGDNQVTDCTSMSSLQCPLRRTRTLLTSARLFCRLFSVARPSTGRRDEALASVGGFSVLLS
jgi:hypothetical protein